MTDLSGGRCRVEWTMAMKSARDGSGFVSKVSGRVMTFMVGRMLRKFGRLVESRATTAVGR